MIRRDNVNISDLDQGVSMKVSRGYLRTWYIFLTLVTDLLLILSTDGNNYKKKKKLMIMSLSKSAIEIFVLDY